MQPQVEGRVSKQRRLRQKISPCRYLQSRLEAAAHAQSFGIGAAAAAAFARSSKSSRRGRNAGQRTMAPRPTEDRRSTAEAKSGIWRMPATEVSAVPHQPSANSSSRTRSSSSQRRGAPAASLRAKAESDAGGRSAASAMPRRARRNHSLLGQNSGRACSAAATTAALPRPASSARSSHLHSAPRAGGARWRHCLAEAGGFLLTSLPRSRMSH